MPEQKISLSASEQNHLVKLVTDRESKQLLNTDPGVLKRVMNSLCKKGMAIATDNGWSLTDAGLERSKSIY